MIELPGGFNRVMRAQPLPQWPPLTPAPSLDPGFHVLTLWFWGVFLAVLHSMWSLSSLIESTPPAVKV